MALSCLAPPRKVHRDGHGAGGSEVPANRTETRDSAAAQIREIGSVPDPVARSQRVKGMDMAMRKCKECGRDVSTKAKVCPGCGAPAPTTTTVSAGVGCLIILIASCGVFSLVNKSMDRDRRANPSGSNAGPAGAGPSFVPPTPSKASQLAKLKVESPTFVADDVVATYAENEIKGDGALKGKWFKVSGPVDSIAKDILGTPYVTLKTSDPGQFRQVQCMFAEKDAGALAALRPGQRLVVFGKCDGLMMNVLMRECEIVP